MTLRTLIAAAALAAVATAACAQDQAPAGDAKKGQALFRADGCWECHGTVGQGGAATAPEIGPMDLPYDAFIQQLRTPQNEMPPYEKASLSDADAADIYAFLKTIPASPKAKDVPLLNSLK